MKYSILWGQKYVYDLSCLEFFVKKHTFEKPAIIGAAIACILFSICFFICYTPIIQHCIKIKAKTKLLQE